MGINKSISIIMLLLFSVITHAYVPIEMYKGIRLKFYDNSLETKQKLYTIIDSINITYFEDVNSISVFNHYNTPYLADVTLDNNIRLYKNGIYKSVVIHELAHICQTNKGDDFLTNLQHRGYFHECEVEIWRESSICVK